ncbi:hypothetical protein, partial [Klebsiella pneumoniae]|uniref:hypothetical protein n=1 Tax=Klebsiella pneumoniae TaxID=573 RepID=UPI001C71B6D6
RSGRLVVISVGSAAILVRCGWVWRKLAGVDFGCRNMAFVFIEVSVDFCACVIAILSLAQTDLRSEGQEVELFAVLYCVDADCAAKACELLLPDFLRLGIGVFEIVSREKLATLERFRLDDKLRCVQGSAVACRRRTDVGCFGFQLVDAVRELGIIVLRGVVCGRIKSLTKSCHA